MRQTPKAHNEDAAFLYTITFSCSKLNRILMATRARLEAKGKKLNRLQAKKLLGTQKQSDIRRLIKSVG